MKPFLLLLHCSSSFQGVLQPQQAVSEVAFSSAARGQPRRDAHSKDEPGHCLGAVGRDAGECYVGHSLSDAVKKAWSGKACAKSLEPLRITLQKTLGNVHLNESQPSVDLARYCKYDLEACLEID